MREAVRVAVRGAVTVTVTVTVRLITPECRLKPGLCHIMVIQAALIRIQRLKEQKTDGLHNKTHQPQHAAEYLPLTLGHKWPARDIRKGLIQ